MRKELETMDEKMQVWFQNARKYDDNKFHFQVDPQTWSLQQVLLHLVQVQEGVTLFLQKYMEKNQEMKSSKIKNWYRYMMLRMALRSKKKYKVPKSVSNVPNDLSLPDLQKTWNDSMMQFDAMLENFPPQMKNKLVFKHPVIGWINIDQTVGFMIEHMNHHQRQIESLYSQLDSK